MSTKKEYLVDVKVGADGYSEKLEKRFALFKCGIKLGEKRTQPAKAVLIGVEGSVARFNIILKEGMKRQIRQT